MTVPSITTEFKQCLSSNVQYVLALIIPYHQANITTYFCLCQMTCD